MLPTSNPDILTNFTELFHDKKHEAHGRYIISLSFTFSFIHFFVFQFLFVTLQAKYVHFDT